MWAINAGHASIIVKIAPAKQPADHFHGKPTVGKKARLLCAAAWFMGKLPRELALPHLFQPQRPVHFAVTQCLVDIATVQTSLTKLLTDTPRAIA
ncbi:hypothetical protein WR25_10406 [Diploscapter pachys]|uniref:Uncharacterized protein n=1 Tax=Diploscapter pachys TaxID=2018661 RepID=A0A2A2M5H3_9BILA|nr:hypothetical protein WR25_10406 [Diploscapter pachys]